MTAISDIPAEGSATGPITTPNATPNTGAGLGPTADSPSGSPRRWNWSYIIVITGVHALACLAVLPWLFAWEAAAAAAIGVIFFGQGINLGYHRLLSHRSFKVPRWFEHAIVIIAICCLQGSPISWVTAHRRHHRDSDGPDDPHSPRKGFWWAHMGWLAAEKPAAAETAAISRHARDLLADPFYRRIQRYPLLQLAIFAAHAALFFALGFAIGHFGGAGPGAGGGLQMGLSFVVWGVFVRAVLVWHITWSVNSATHVWGSARYETGDDSRNNWVVALIAMGEGWHNNHHHDQAAATVQHRWWQLDPTYYVVVLLRWLGIATSVIPVRARRRSAIPRP